MLPPHSKACVGTIYHGKLKACELYNDGRIDRLYPFVGTEAGGFMGVAIKGQGACDSQEAKDVEINSRISQFDRVVPFIPVRISAHPK